MIAHDISPEALAQKIYLSNMTIRRMLRRRASEKISEKYWPMFDQLLADSIEITDLQLLKLSKTLFTDFSSLTQDLEKSGQEHQDITQLKDDVCTKMKREAIGSGLKLALNTLLSTLSRPNSSLRSRAIAAGALLYFLNPIDLIPDALVGVGYLDDISVAGIAISALTSKSKSNKQTRKKLTH